MEPADEEPGTLSELIVLAENREKARGYAITIDQDYASDVQAIVSERKPWTPRTRE